MTTNGDLPKAIQEKLASLDREREAVLKMVPAYHDVSAACLASDITTAPHLSTGSTISSVMVSSPVESMEQVAVFLRYLAKLGYHQTAKPRDFPEERKRWYALNHPEKGDADLFAHFPSNARCRFVQVGEKTVPVMELRCEDDAPALPPLEITGAPALAAVFGPGGGA